MIATVPAVFDYAVAPFPIRADLPRAFRDAWMELAGPGGSLTGRERVSLAHSARLGGPGEPLHQFARLLYSDPAAVEGSHVAHIAQDVGYPNVVETVGIISRLSAVDRFHSVIGLPLEPLPDPVPGEPTGEITEGLKVRAGHVPMPPGPIPYSLGLIPAEIRALAAIDGPLYMTHEEMDSPTFRRNPGLNRPQLELIAARTSMINECFY